MQLRTKIGILCTVSVVVSVKLIPGGTFIGISLVDLCRL